MKNYTVTLRRQRTERAVVTFKANSASEAEDIALVQVESDDWVSDDDERNEPEPEVIDCEETDLPGGQQ